MRNSTIKALGLAALLVILVTMLGLALVSCANTTKYLVTFDPDNGDLPFSITAEEGKTISAPTEPTKDDLVFDGWYNGDVKWDFGTSVVTENVLLIAKWTEKDYTIKEARNVAKGTTVKVDGVVARITYAFGQVPNGFVLVDETSSIYVFDKDAAGSVSIGNKVTLKGVKDYWILEDETDSAAKFGYGGSNQIANVTMLDNDKGNNAFDTAWITETCVKDIIDTPITEDITSLVYKVNALVKKAPGTGFTNYYFLDIDGETGSYTYTQCNGSDFAWLDQFDGKICTVYLTALNAKSSPTGCVFRFLPVAVYDENYSFDLSKTPEYVLKYLALGQFNESYFANPALEVITSASSELLGFENATLTYASDNETVAKFTQNADTLTFECLSYGEANITVTATYGEYSATKTVKITYSEPTAADALDIAGAISAELNEVITVTGIVGPSLVNKDGFYLIDETGVIAVVVKERSILAGLELGNKVIITGKRDRFHNGTGTHAGQTCITNAEIDYNLYGSHDYSRDSFVTDMTVEQFVSLDKSVDYSTTVFVLRATVSVTGNGYYTLCTLTDGTNSISLYSSSANQYSFLTAYAGQEVTVEIAACNWNNKNFWVGCVLSATTDGGTTVYNTLNFDSN